VAWVSSYTSGSRSVSFSEMQWGKFGAGSKSSPVSEWEWFVSSTDGKTAKEIGCTDGKVVKEASDALGHTLKLYASSTCKSRWAVATNAKPDQVLEVTISRTKGNVRFTKKSLALVTTPMVQVRSPYKACATLKLSQSSLTVCG